MFGIEMPASILFLLQPKNAYYINKYIEVKGSFFAQ